MDEVYGLKHLEEMNKILKKPIKATKVYYTGIANVENRRFNIMDWYKMICNDVKFKRQVINM